MAIKGTFCGSFRASYSARGRQNERVSLGLERAYKLTQEYRVELLEAPSDFRCPL